MKKRSLRRPLRYERDQTGCIWGLISIFDFRHGRSPQKLLSDRRRWSRHAVVDGQSRTKFNMLKNVDDNCQSIEDGEAFVIAPVDATKTSVKELMEEEMFNEEDPNKPRNGDELELRELDSNYEGHKRKNIKRTKKGRKKSCDIQDLSFDATRDRGPETSSPEVREEILDNIDLEVIMEDLCRVHWKNSSCVKHDRHDGQDMQSNEMYSIDKEKISAAIKVFASQMNSNGKYLGDDGEFNHTKEFMDALHTLRSHKESFIKFLKDPNSPLVKHIQGLEDTQLQKDQNSYSLPESNLSSEGLSNSKPEIFNTHKYRNFFRRRSKSQETIPVKENDGCQPSSRIVILKPGPAGLRNSDNEIDFSTPLQSHGTIQNKAQSEKNASQFSFTEIKRKIKHAMGKERHGINPTSTTRGFPREHQNLSDTDKGVGGENGGWSSPNRNHFYTERYAKPSIGKRGDKFAKFKDFEASMINETTSYSEQGVSDIYIEAKKHLLEMLSNGDENAELMSRQLPKTLGRILSLPEYNFSPNGSPPKDREHCFVTAQMRLSPHSNFHMVNENARHLMPEKNAVHSSPSSQNFENRSCITDESQSENVESHALDVNAHEFDHDNSVEESMCSIRDVKSSEGIEITKPNNTGHTDESKALDVSNEKSSPLITGDLHYCDSTEVCDEQRFSQSSKLDKFEEDQVSTSPSASPSSSLATRKIEDPESAIDRTERPSPISVLEPLFNEDDISPPSIAYRSVGSAVEPLQIHFEEQVSSAPEQDLCVRICMENEESAFEYVEALLLGSDLNWDEYLLRWLSFNLPLDASLFGEVELFSNRSCHEQKLLFDCTNEVLKEVCELYFGCFPRLSFAKHSIRPVPKGMKLIHEVWEGVEWHLLQQPTPRSLDQLVRKDLAKSGMWVDLRFDIEHIGIEMGEAILEDLMEETIGTFVSNSLEGEVSVLPELNQNESSINL